MRIKLVLLTIIVLALGLAVFAGPKTISKSSGAKARRAVTSIQTDPVGQLATEVADAFKAKDLGKLDADHPYLGSVRVRVDHSLGPRVQIRRFSTLAQVERWFKRGGLDPNRSAGALKGCRRGVCTFEQEGMLHNTLYLKRITYGMRKGRPYIKSIELIDGD
ncbi:MAG: hypothetical protein M3362_13860 [Acidobacteriota bacterium]|nr:hypothetical protein [Acidobacteriota bacterium]